jgi:hypothetical protein
MKELLAAKLARAYCVFTLAISDGMSPGKLVGKPVQRFTQDSVVALSLDP